MLCIVVEVCMLIGLSITSIRGSLARTPSTLNPGSHLAQQPCSSHLNRDDFIITPGPQCPLLDPTPPFSIQPTLPSPPGPPPIAFENGMEKLKCPPFQRLAHF